MGNEKHYDCKPLGPDTWQDFEDLFGANGAVGGCWCLLWRSGHKEFETNKGEGNRLAMRRLVDEGKTPGVLLYEDDLAAGWCSVAPREDFTYFETTRTLKPIDDEPVWCVSCFFMRRDYRRRGLSGKLIRGVIDYVRERGGHIIEAYPSVPMKRDMIPDAFAWTGLATIFERAGFETVEERGSRRIMRYYMLR
jgi:GNAT superfamily N-acetyltransferase